jgi:hypothetical protein
LFAEVDADAVFAAQLERAKSEVNSLDEDFLLQVDDESYALRILSKVRVDPLHFKFDEAHISTHERMIPSEQHPGHKFFLEPGRSYSRQIIRYHLPFDGDPGLLRCYPNPRIMWSMKVDVQGHEICFDLVNWGGKPDEVKREADNIFGSIRQQHEHLAKQVEVFNTSAQSQILQLLAGRREKLKKDGDFVTALGLPVKEPPSERAVNSSRQHRPPARPSLQPKPTAASSWDVFISHASEDKEDFVRDLAHALGAQDLKVWYDEFTLSLGDSLRRSIDNGLANSRFGIVVLSHNFFAKEWPQRELDGLVAKEVISGKLILPVWHNVTKEDVAAFSPILADRLAVSSDKGTEQVVNEILNAIKRKT